jgi:hypothetical protein
MFLRIYNCPDKKRFLPLMRKATQYFAQELMVPKVLENLRLQIRFDASLEEYGYASFQHQGKLKKDWLYLVEINPSIGARDILDTLAHEMVHVKQYVYGETNESLTRWRGELVADDVDYFLHPWEIEAYGLSRGLFTKFVIQEKLWEVFDNIKDPHRQIEPVPLGWINP